MCLGASSFQCSLRRLVQGLSTLVTVLCVSSVALGETQNGRISGDIGELYNLTSISHLAGCSAISCPLPTKVIRLTLKPPHGPHINIKLVEASVANPVRQHDLQQTAVNHTPAKQLPILLRGYIQARSHLPGRSSNRVPVAASLFSTGTDILLEVTVPRSHMKEDKKPHALMVFRSFGSSLQTSARLNSRVQAPPTWLLSPKVCGIETAADSHDIDQLSFAAASSKATGSTPPKSTYQVLFLATDYDPHYARTTGCQTNTACFNRILSIVHRASVFYQEQLGYTLIVARQFGPTGLNSSSIAEQLLDSFQQHNFENRFQYVHTGSNAEDNQVDLFQLFTGRNLDDDTIGIAYVDTACRNDKSRFTSFLVQRVSDVLDPVTTAHEVGHTLSALHSSTGIMRPRLGQDPPSSFESSSLVAISNHLSQWYPECRQGLSSGARQPKPSPSNGGNSSDNSNPFRGKPVTLGLALDSDTPRTLTVTATVSSLQPNCSVRLHIGTTSLGSLRSPAISERTPQESTVSWIGDARFRVALDGRRPPFVYFVAEHSCADGSVLEVSRVRKYNPNKVKGLKKATRSKRAWLKEFTQTLR